MQPHIHPALPRHHHCGQHWRPQKAPGQEHPHNKSHVHTTRKVTWQLLEGLMAPSTTQEPGVERDTMGPADSGWAPQGPADLKSSSQNTFLSLGPENTGPAWHSLPGISPPVPCEWEAADVTWLMDHRGSTNEMHHRSQCTRHHRHVWCQQKAGWVWLECSGAGLGACLKPGLSHSVCASTAQQTGKGLGC